MVNEVLTVLVTGEDENWDEYTAPIAVGFDRAELEAYIAQLQLEQSEYFRISKLHTEFLDAWVEQNPRPEMGRDQMKDIPKWRPGIGEKDITPEMRAEREQIKADNAVLVEDYRSRHSQWATRMEKACREHLASLGLSAEEQQSHLHGASHQRPKVYSISSLPFIGKMTPP